MRTFTDAEGHPWQAALLDGSWGAVFLVFSRAGDATVRKGDMAAANLAEAQAQLALLDEAGLRAALAAAEPWDPAADA